MTNSTKPTLNYPAMLKIIASNLYESYDVPDEFISVIENAAEAFNIRTEPTYAQIEAAAEALVRITGLSITYCRLNAKAALQAAGGV